MYFGNREHDKKDYLAELIAQSEASMKEAEDALKVEEAALKEATAPIELLNAKKAKKVQLLAKINERQGTPDEREKDNQDAYGLERDIAQLDKDLNAAHEAVEPFQARLNAAHMNVQTRANELHKYKTNLSIILLSEELTALENAWMAKHKEMVAQCKSIKASYYNPNTYKPDQQVQAYRASIGYR